MGKRNRGKKQRKEKPAPPTGRSLLQELAPGALAIAVLVAAAYIPVYGCGFIWDDPEYVINNLNLRTADGLETIWFEPGQEHSTPQYYPLVFTTLWVEYQLWQDEATGYHVVNVLLHAFSSILLWIVLRRLAVPGAWAAAAVFALHPVCVESVAWITERKNVLSLLFYLAALLAWLRFAMPGESDAARSRKGLYLLCILFFLCALLSKTVTATFPATAALVLWWKKGRFTREDVLPLVPLFVLGVGMALVTVHLEKHHVGALGDEWSLSLVEHGLLAGRIPCFYAAKLAWPFELIFFYPRWVLDSSVWWQYLFPLAAAAAVVFLWLGRRRFGRGPLTAVLFFTGSLVPALGFFNVYPMRFSFVADHFQYLPAIGLIVLAAGAVATGVGKLGSDARRAAPYLCAAILALLGFLTWGQCGIYQDQVTLWRDTIARNPGCWIAHSNLGEILTDQGDLKGAMLHCERAAELKPDLPEARGNLANVYYRLKRYDDAVEQYEVMIRLGPEKGKLPRAHFNLATILGEMGERDLREKRKDQARQAFARAAEHCEDALRLIPANPDVHLQLAKTLYFLEEYGRAAFHYRKVMALAPEHSMARNELAATLSAMESKQGAGVLEKHLEEALRADSGSTAIRLDLAELLRRQGRFAEASVHYTAALKIDSRLFKAHYGLGKIALDQGERENAVFHFRAILRAGLGWHEVEFTLARLLATDSRSGPAEAAEAVRLAEAASDRARNRNPELLDIKAMAYARAGRFDDAAAAARKAIDQARSRNDEKLAEEIARRLGLYESERPFDED